ncbi:Integral membrane protein 2C, partial [Eschrichtius robustus]|nr:Integral membrane protein 2C [Eschrichtius robustus]
MSVRLSAALRARLGKEDAEEGALALGSSLRLAGALASTLTRLHPDTVEEGLNDGSHRQNQAWGFCNISSVKEAREERPPYHRYKKGSSVGGLCYLSMGMVVLLMGLVFASVYIYRYFFLAQGVGEPQSSLWVYALERYDSHNFFHCGVLYEDSLSSQVRTRMELEEDVKIYLEENYERINVPVPQFGGGDPADIIHDFQRGLTAYHDISLDKCYVIELNTTIVLPPRNFWELLMNVKRGTYLPQTYIIQEEMVVTEHVSDKEALGSFIYHLCSGKDTYRLRRRATRRRINKRGAKNCNAIRHFENTFVVETLICGVA